MSSRTWTKESLGNHQWGYVIRCAGCQKTDRITSEMGRDLAASKAPVTFQRRGWQIGKRAGCDYCYSCIVKFKAINHKTAERKAMPAATVTPISAARADPPPELSKADKRVIFQKLEEVYIDEATGYQKGWDDNTVARDLGVERAWVAQVREDNFGPEKSEDFTRILQEGAECVAEARDLLAQHNKAQEMYQAIARASVKLSLRLDKLDSELKEIQKRSHPKK
jgi:hypothetical protein